MHILSHRVDEDSGGNETAYETFEFWVTQSGGQSKRRDYILHDQCPLERVKSHLHPKTPLSPKMGKKKKACITSAFAGCLLRGGIKMVMAPLCSTGPQLGEKSSKLLLNSCQLWRGIKVATSPMPSRRRSRSPLPLKVPKMERDLVG